MNITGLALPLITAGLLVALLSCGCGVHSAEDAKPSGPGYWTVSDTAGLLAALAEAGPAGGAIVLKPGSYVLEKTVALDNVRLLNIEGSGWSTQIVRRGDGDALVLKDCAFCVIKNLMISGDSSAKSGSGISFRGNSSSNMIDLCRITGFAQSGVHYEGNPKTPMSSNTVKDCHFIDNGGDQLYSFNNNDFYITGNQFGAHGRQGKSAPRTGCVLDHSSAGTYTRNYHWGNKNAFRLGPGAHYDRIENNRFEESYEAGVIIGDPKGDSSFYNILTGNTIHTNSKGETGVHPAVVAYNSRDIIFCTNQIFSWDTNTYKHKSSLVVVTGCAHWIVKDNTMRNNTGPTLVYDKDAGHIVSDNVTD